MNSKNSTNHTLDEESILKIESTKLSQIDRHYLRLLAHCLATFKSMAKGSIKGDLPNEKIRFEWLSQQKEVANDPIFLKNLLQQFDIAANQLEQLAESSLVTPLELTVEDLIKATKKSDKRLN